MTQRHLDAGADHVVVNLLTESPAQQIEGPLRQIAAAIMSAIGGQ